jgi:hypothetical protein
MSKRPEERFLPAHNNEPALRALRARFEATPARFAAFHEPDRGGELTAFCAAGASARRLCARLPMAFTP